MKGLYQQRGFNAIVRIPKGLDRCLRVSVYVAGAASSTLHGCIIPPWLRQFTQGGTLVVSLFTDVMCSSHSRSVPLSSRDDALSRAMDQEIPFERKIITESPSSLFVFIDLRSFNNSSTSDSGCYSNDYVD